jgi:hypothetical protein
MRRQTIAFAILVFFAYATLLSSAATPKDTINNPKKPTEDRVKSPEKKQPLQFEVNVLPNVLDLGRVDEGALLICKEIEKKYSSGKQFNIGFYLKADIEDMAKFTFKDGKWLVYFHPLALTKGSIAFKVLAAHEIGHIILNTSDEIKADSFAVKVVGSKEIVKKTWIDLDMSPDNPRILALSK